MSLIDEKLDRILEHLSELRTDLAVHIAEDRALHKEVQEMRKIIPGLQKTAILGRAVGLAVLAILGSAGAWATGVVDFVKLFGKH